MTHRSRLFTAVCALFAAALMAPAPSLRGQGARPQQITAVTSAELRSWDSQVDRMIRSRQLELRLDREDTLIQGRRHRDTHKPFAASRSTVATWCASRTRAA